MEDQEVEQTNERETRPSTSTCTSEPMVEEEESEVADGEETAFIEKFEDKGPSARFHVDPVVELQPDMLQMVRSEVTNQSIPSTRSSSSDSPALPKQMPESTGNSPTGSGLRRKVGVTPRANSSEKNDTTPLPRPTGEKKPPLTKPSTANGQPQPRDKISAPGAAEDTRRRPAPNKKKVPAQALIAKQPPSRTSKLPMSTKPVKNEVTFEHCEELLNKPFSKLSPAELREYNLLTRSQSATKEEGPSTKGSPVASTKVTTSSELKKLIPDLRSPEDASRTVTIVFDLDETLVNNRKSNAPLFRPHAIELLKAIRGDNPHPVYKKKNSMSVCDRLYLNSIERYVGTISPGAGQKARRGSVAAELEEASPERQENELHVELILWTASTETTARSVVAKLDPQGKIFDQIIYRDFRWYQNAFYVKDLTRLGRKMSRVVIVENSLLAVRYNRINSILVSDFVRLSSDIELLYVKRILLEWMEEVRSAEGMEKGKELSPELSRSFSSPLDRAEPEPRPTSAARPSRSSLASEKRESVSKKSSVATTISVSTRSTPSRADSEPTKASQSPLPERSASEHDESSKSSSFIDNMADDIRVFLRFHRFIGGNTNYLRIAWAKHQPKPKVKAAPRPKPLTIPSSKPTPSEPVWNRLYSSAQKKVELKESKVDTRKTVPPPPPPKIPRVACKPPPRPKFDFDDSTDSSDSG